MLYSIADAMRDLDKLICPFEEYNTNRFINSQIETKALPKEIEYVKGLEMTADILGEELKRDISTPGVVKVYFLYKGYMFYKCEDVTDAGILPDIT